MWREKHTSGCKSDSSGYLIIREVQNVIRAVTKLYEWFETGYERLIKYTRGSEANRSGLKRDSYDYKIPPADRTGYERLRVVRNAIRAVNEIYGRFGRKYERFETSYV
ncbi:hypothetical protein [Sporosarcina cyprini]|uniref:hypothetical protein n=1 Tax=Sporosarcina cyprini TaxID=2910523 RepID=UPI001EE0EAC1|nr:hypothetical protein [Sporosarcina cyprini]MCG3087020.1 hypothetical protein [Sporosarcina cyprini]